MNTLDTILEFIRYKLVAKTKYDIHSPFLYEWITQVLEDTSAYKDYSIIASYKASLQKKSTIVIPQDFGAGSKSIHSKLTLSTLLNKTAINHHYGSILYKTIRYYKPKSIVELGTGTGISTLYMALANSLTNVYTIEGNKDLHAQVAALFHLLNIQNVHAYQGHFNNILPQVLSGIDVVDFAFIDGNHQKNATIAYYDAIKKKCTNNSIIVFDDIRWSKEMMQAWQTIIADHDIRLSLDLFRMGIVFFKNEIKQKQHYAIAC